MAESSAKLKKKQVDPLKRTVFSLALPIFFSHCSDFRSATLTLLCCQTTMTLQSVQ